MQKNILTVFRLLIIQDIKNTVDKRFLKYALFELFDVEKRKG